MDAGSYCTKNDIVNEELAEVGTVRGAKFFNYLLDFRIVNNVGVNEDGKLDAGIVEGWADLQDVGDVFYNVARTCSAAVTLTVGRPVAA